MVSICIFGVVTLMRFAISAAPTLGFAAAHAMSAAICGEEDAAAACASAFFLAVSCACCFCSAIT